MSKILAVSDIHINDYPHRNPTNRYRLYQGSRTVAKNIIEAGKKYGCEYIVFAGDIIEKSIIGPLVLSEVWNFLNAIMLNFKGGWIIWGNHDMASRVADQDRFDSCLGVILPPNLKYAHRSIVNVDNVSIAFNNYQPEFDLTWIDNKVDILFTHATICYSNNDSFMSQELDESKFDIAFCGDIHRPGEIGKYVSIGIPQKCKMTDSDISCGIVLDCVNKSWDRVDLNPNNNLMKFQYVSDIEEEGWKPDIMTFNVFKKEPENIINPVTGGLMTEWDKIEGLVNDSIINAGLQNIHTDILNNIKDIDAGEVDFNFTLHRMYCKNWRSIEEAEIYFNNNDRILLVGENGSGKSSLISAIKYAFCGAKIGGLTSLSPFIQFGTKKCTTEIEFSYQGNKYKLRRSSSTNIKDYGLWINDEPQKYSNKPAFDTDCENRFPFIKYIDVLIHDQDHNQFIGSNSGERLAEIISKAFKLDKIDTYNDTAQCLLSKLKMESSSQISKVKECERLIEFIDSKINGIVLPQDSKENLMKYKEEGIVMQEKANLWMNYSNTSSNIQTSIEFTNKEILDLTQKINSFRDVNLIDAEINQKRELINSLNDKLVNLAGAKDKLSLKSAELNRIINEGKRLRAEVDKIDPNKVSKCPTCGNNIVPDENTINALTNRKNELNAQLQEKLNEHGIVSKEVKELEYIVNQQQDEYNSITNQINSTNSEISMLLTEKNIQHNTREQLNLANNKLTDLNNKFNSLGIPEKVILPNDFAVKMSEIQNNITAWEIWESSMIDKQKAEADLSIAQNLVNNTLNYAKSLEDYIKLTGPTGFIYKEVMEKLVSRFNDSLVNYEVSNREYRKKTHLTLIPQYNNNGNWVSYEACSGGQKTVLDIHFLSKILPQSGLFILDEFLKYLSPGNAEICMDMINNMNINCLFISSHQESLQINNNRSCSLKLNDSGCTVIELT